MLNYINADLYRIFRRIPRWIMVGIVMVVIAVLFWPDSNSDSTIIELAELLESTLKYVPVYIGFIEIIYVFGDDFAGKTAQIAIGTGVKRNQVIFAKWIEFVITVATDVVMIVVISLVLSVVKTHYLPAQILGDLIAHMIISILATGAYVSLVFPIMFAMQTITVAFLIYIIIAAGAINKIIGLISGTKLLKHLMIENYTLTNCLNVFRSRMVMGNFHFESILGIIIYICLFIYLTTVVYKKRELEF